MANAQYGSGLNLDALMVPTQAATVFAAQENSLYLPGTMVPIVQVPAGSASAQVAVMGSVTASAITSEGTGTDPQDFDTLLPSDAKVPVALQLIAARTVLRDFGGIDTADMGRIMGNAIAAKVDSLVSAKLGDLFDGTIGGTAPIAPGSNLLHDLYDAIGIIRGNGETGTLACVVAPAAYGDFMEKIGSSAFAGGETQNAAMRSGFIGMIAGVPCYVSASYGTHSGLGTPKFTVFSQDALRIAMQGGVNLEVERRAAAVGNDIVASAAFGVDIIDETRGVSYGTA
jgi:hypothetical protein